MSPVTMNCHCMQQTYVKIFPKCRISFMHVFFKECQITSCLQQHSVVTKVIVSNNLHHANGDNNGHPCVISLRYNGISLCPVVLAMKEITLGLRGSRKAST